MLPAVTKASAWARVPASSPSAARALQSKATELNVTLGVVAASWKVSAFVVSIQALLLVASITIPLVYIPETPSLSLITSSLPLLMKVKLEMIGWDLDPNQSFLTLLS